MNKKDNNQTRIFKIKEERYELLKEVRDNINSGNEKVIENANNLIKILNYDEKNIKKYQALKEAQSLIESLTKDIVNAKTKEEIESLRKRLNYYINKIKNEAKKRNIDYSNYYEHVTSIRKNISKYIRFIKKYDSIEVIEKTNNNYDELDEQARKILSRQISNARDYNTRILREKKSNSVLVDNILHNENIDIIEKDKEQKELTLDDIKKKKDRTRNAVITLDEINKRSAKSKRNSEIEDFRRNNRYVFQPTLTYSSDEDFISSKVTEFNNRYSLNEPLHYDSTIGKNMLNFVKNLSIYNANKKILKRILFDYSCFHHSRDLGIYAEYVKNDNSIVEGLRRVFNKSSLYSKEIEYLDNHDRCVNWILYYVRNNDIQLNYRLVK